ncbi:hypothetical protein GQS40_09385|uniref:Uncharacterized protein n=1 Tax=Leuconostoc lactis TaxID=1246 RepID=A0A6L7AB89_LEULA|nr:hypothetical protein [Leuconostoc lactis]
MIKKYWRSQFKWLFLSSILESIGANLFGIVLLMMIAANFTGENGASGKRLGNKNIGNLNSNQKADQLICFFSSDHIVLIFMA